MTDPVFSLNEGNGEREQLGVYDDFAATGNPPADFVPGLVNLGFIKAAIRRSVWFVTFLAAVGLIGGLAYYVKYPKAYQASASLLITLSPYEDSQTCDRLTTRPWRRPRRWLRSPCSKLGLQQSISTFLKTVQHLVLHRPGC